MFWEESKQEEERIVPDDIVDMVYSISCRCLPVDHAYNLSSAIHEALPWFGDEEDAAMHTIHVAESGNGWMRPDEPDALLYPSRRSKLTLRVPRHRIADAESLVGKTMDIDNVYTIAVNKFSVRPLSDITTLFARYIVADDAESETQFMEKMIEQMRAMDVRPKKMLCGIEKQIHTPEGDIKTRSLMMADLEFRESILLQQKGLGDHRRMGCGIFIPHKDIHQISEERG
jgi:CRISPR-associated protein Cas6